MKSADELAKSAEGNIKKKHLTETGGIINTYLYDSPIIEHLDEDEQPEYIFKHDTKGFRVTKETGDEKTPHHNSTDGRRYLLVTSHRVLYIAGVDDGDESMVFPYEKIASVDSSCGVKSYIIIKSKYGTEYKFCANYESKNTIEAAVEYIQSKISSSNIKKSARDMEDTEPINVRNISNLTIKPSDKDNTSEEPSIHEPDYTTRGKEIRISGNTNEKTNCGKINVYYDRIEIQQKGTVLSKGWLTICFKYINNLSISTLGKLKIMTMNNDYRISGLGGQSGRKIQLLYQLYPAREHIRQEFPNIQMTGENELKVIKRLGDESHLSDNVLQELENLLL